MSIDTVYLGIQKMEIRIIGTKEELEQAAIQIAACYKIKHGYPFNTPPQSISSVSVQKTS